MKENRVYNVFILYLSLTIVVFLTGIFVFFLLRTRGLFFEETLDQARAHFNTIVLVRKWNAGYSGVYVEKTPGMQSNPYLKNPDIQSVDGKTYTLKTPATMTREISEYTEKEGLYAFHMTSLRPLNPDNRADPFEERALRSFERGDKEAYEMQSDGGTTYFRYCAPLLVEQSCLKCHAQQGYQVGDIRGGISVTMDVQDHVNRRRQNLLAIAVSGLSIMTLLLAVTLFIARRYDRRLAEAREKLRVLAVTDELTGTFNRRRLMELFHTELERAKRLNHGLGCVMLDIDHFKSINDTHGHPAGDKVLSEVAVHLKKGMRAYDILGRYGGEEFVVLLPESNFEYTRVFAEKIRRVVKEIPVAAMDLPEAFHITISAGIACLRDEQDTVDSLIGRADEGLYKAKNAGRDRIEWV